MGAYIVVRDEVAVTQSPEADRIIQICDGEVERCEECGLASKVGREACQDSGIKVSGIFDCEAVRDTRAEGVAGADYMFEGGGSECAISEHENEGVRYSKLEGALTDSMGIRMGAEAGAETIVGERSVTRRRGDIDITVARGNIPIWLPVSILFRVANTVNKRI